MDEKIIPLRLSFTPQATADLRAILDYLNTRSVAGIENSDASRRFGERFDVILDMARENIAREIGEGRRPSSIPDDVASAFFSQPIYRLNMETVKKRSRRSSAGLWFIFYSLRDANADGLVDTLRVHHIRHSAARPLSVEGETEADE